MTPPIASAAAGLLLALLAASSARSDELVRVATDTLRIDFSATGGAPASWEACHPACAAPRARMSLGADGAAAALELAALDDAELAARLRALRYRIARTREAGGERLDFVSEPLEPGVHVEKTYWIPWRGYRVTAEIRVAGPRGAEFLQQHRLGLRLGAGGLPAAHPDDARGAPAARWVAVEDGAQRELAQDEHGVALRPGSWSGARTRFWAFLARPASGATRARVAPDALELSADLRSDSRLELYAGPLDHRELEAVDPALTGLLFAERWPPLRWLCIGLLWLLEAITAVFENVGASILLLSVVVKILLRPLTAIAERWQSEVEAVRGQLEPELRRIRQLYRGEEQSRRLFDAHRASGVTPFYGLKSGLGLLLQIPVFFAAYHTLDEAFLLHGRSFFWISDLAQPDRAAVLPVALPWFGDGLNLLPFAMTGVTLIASRLHRGADPAAASGQRRGLYAMAAAFFVLFYAFPAGMVLYWTTNGVALLLREQWLARSTSPLPARAGVESR